MWYEPSVFQVELQRLGVDVETCTERECVIALRETSKLIREYSDVYKNGLVQYAGPQCYPQLKDAARLGANSCFGKRSRQRTSLVKGVGALERRLVPAVDDCLAIAGPMLSSQDRLPD